jgi:phage baseplate assembly protein V
MKDSAAKRFMDPIKSKIALAFARAVVKLIKDDKKIQRMQVELLKDEIRDDIERFQDYGFTSHPESGAEAVVGFMGGDRSHGIILKVDDRRYRLTGLAAGEVAMYHRSGSKIVMKADGTIEATGSTFKVNGDIVCTGDITDKDGSMGEMRSTYNGHDHTETGGTTHHPNQPMT